MDYKTGNKMSGISTPLIFVLLIALIYQLMFLMNGHDIRKISDDDNIINNKIENVVKEKDKVKIVDVLQSPLGNNIVKFSKNGTSCEIMWQKNMKSDNIIGELKKFDDIGINIKKLNIKSENFNVIIEIEGNFGAEE